MNHASQSTRDKWRQIIQAQRASGLSIAGYCRRHGIAASALYVWKQRLVHEPSEPAFVQVPTTAESQVSAGADAAGHAAVLEVCLGGGRRLRVGRGFDHALLAEVVGVLEGLA
jgi:hypothetical protein